MNRKKKILIAAVCLLLTAAIGFGIYYFAVKLPEQKKIEEIQQLMAEHYENRVALFTEENKNYSPGEVDVVFLGDSLTEGYDLDTFYPQYVTVNRGIGGDTTDGLWERLEVSAYELEPKVVVMLIGANNFDTMFERMDVKKIFTLSNGVEMPGIGFGTWKAKDGETAYDSIIEALKAGYRHIDTAAMYRNEASVGKAVKECGLKREDIFVTSKVWNKNRGYEKTLAAFEKTLATMELDYLDLYLIHWPAIPLQFEDWDEINLGTWKAMIELYKAGKIKAIGVANFYPKHLESLMKTEVPPMVNQIEYHPGYTQDEVVKYCQENGIVVQGWSPLGNGAVLGSEFLAEIAAKYNKSVAQICIRYAVQNGIVPLPKSVTPSRIAANLDVYDFEISEEDMKAIAAMSETGFSGWNPNEVDF